jgi:IS605 OrfB family transposase
MTDTVSIVRTVRCKLASSQRKDDRVDKIVDEWQAIADTVAQHHPSFPSYEWGNTKQNRSFYRIVQREHPDADIHSQGALAATHKVGEMFASWDSNGRPGNPPSFGDGNYCRFTGQGATLERNDGTYGLKIKLEPYDAEWWRIDAGAFQRDYLKRVLDRDWTLGAVELHRSGGALYAHLMCSTDVEVLEPENANTRVGVDLGENVIYAAAAVNGEVQDVDLMKGREFRHHRERLKRKRDRLMEQDDLRGVRACRDEHRRYTDHVTNVASRRVVDLAVEQEAPVIVLEDLTGYRSSADDAIHDFPYAEVQQKIAYKAREEGIPVAKVDAADTSTTCSECGHTDPRSRDGVEFVCTDCGYEVHADVNAAFNISARA